MIKIEFKSNSSGTRVLSIKMDVDLNTLPFDQEVITFHLSFEQQIADQPDTLPANEVPFAERIVIVRQALRVADQIMRQFDQYPTWEEYCHQKNLTLEGEDR